jgi:PilZ domain-containing protein
LVKRVNSEAARAAAAQSRQFHLRSLGVSLSVVPNGKSSLRGVVFSTAYKGTSDDDPALGETIVRYYHRSHSLTEEGITMGKRSHGKESRWGDRVRVNIPVQVSANALSALGRMKNLSLSGALVKADVDLGMHALIHVHIAISSPSRRLAAITAYVSRKDEEGIGIEWCEFAPSIVKDLLRSPMIPLPS